MSFISKGEVVCTETGVPVYEILCDVELGDPVNASDFKSLCDLPNPKQGEVILSHYNDERFAKTERGHLRFHFKGGYK